MYPKLCIWMFTVALNLSNASKRQSGETWYSLNPLSTFLDCNNYKNNKLDTSGLRLRHDTPSNTSLAGEVQFKTLIAEADNVEVVMRVFKEGEFGREFFYMVSGNLCDNMGDVNVPWNVFFNALHIESCPIEAKTFEAEYMKSNLEFAQGIMNHEAVGDYYATMVLQKPAQGLELTPAQISCHGISAAVVESKISGD